MYARRVGAPPSRATRSPVEATPSRSPSRLVATGAAVVSFVALAWWLRGVFVRLREAGRFPDRWVEIAVAGLRWSGPVLFAAGLAARLCGRGRLAAALFWLALGGIGLAFVHTRMPGSYRWFSVAFVRQEWGWRAAALGVPVAAALWTVFDRRAGDPPGRARVAFWTCVVVTGSLFAYSALAPRVLR